MTILISNDIFGSLPASSFDSASRSGVGLELVSRCAVDLVEVGAVLSQDLACRFLTAEER